MTFRSYCIVSANDEKIICSLLQGNNIITFSPDPTNRFWQNPDGIGTLTYRHGEKDRKPITNDIKMCEVIFNTEDEEVANRILSTIQVGMLLAYPYPEGAQSYLKVDEITQEFNEAIYFEDWYSQRFYKPEDFTFGVLVWTVAKNNPTLLYALEKYKLSLALESITPHSAQPKYGQIVSNYRAEYSYHTRASFAIISAFSSIEEMGLEIRSSSKKPRFINKDTGMWNPLVYEDISQRLAAIQISSNDSIDWIYRGKPTPVEDKLNPYFGIDSEWVDGKTVRAKALTYPEAIHNASYLRNFIAAHKFNELTEFISPYDIFNVQSLVRMLILKKMRLWDTIRQRHRCKLRY